MKDEFDSDLSEFGINNSQFDSDLSEFGIDLSSPESESDKQTEKNHKLRESVLVNPGEAMDRRMRIGASISADNIETITKEDTPSDIAKRQNLVLRRKKPKSDWRVGQELDSKVSELEESKESSEVEIEAPRRDRKDLKLAKSKFSETKKEEYSWSLEALDLPKTKKQVKEAQSSKKKSKKDKDSSDSSKVPIFKIGFAVVVLVGVLVVGVMQKSGKSVGILSGKDMHPTLSESSFYTSSKIKDYSELGYMDIILYEVNGEKIPSRIIGLPGDQIIVKEDGVYLNDEKIDPKMIGGEYDFYHIIKESPDTYKFNNGIEDYLLFKLPKKGDYVFLLGDNHNNARDSLKYGPIEITLIKEKINR